MTYNRRIVKTAAEPQIGPASELSPDEIREILVTNPKKYDSAKRVGAAKSARTTKHIQTSSPDEFISILMEAMKKDDHEMVQREAAISIGAIASFATAAGKAIDLKAAINLLTDMLSGKNVPQRFAPVTEVEFARALAAMGQGASIALPILRKKFDAATTQQSKDIIANTISNIEGEADMADQPLVSDSIYINGPLFWQFIRKYFPGLGKIIPNVLPLPKPKKVKIRFAQNGAFTIGEITQIEMKETDQRGKRIRIPTYTIRCKDQTFDVNALDRNNKIEIWTYNDLEDMPIEKYKGIWIKTDDPMAKEFGKEQEDGTVIGLLMKRDGDTSVIKIMKDDVPWTISVPTSSIRPSLYSTEWGRPYAENKSGLGYLDVVSFPDDPSQPYIVESIENGIATIRPINAKRGAGNVQVDVSELKYLGKHRFGKGLVTEPDFQSPKIKKTPVKQKPADVE